ncbi:hypothetical protein Ae201684P_015787 [Aphanomyces euteiches]|uniref:WRKY transcription factor 19 n=1 Tax=Aphanomyces euteiches TaxID=100861 RepID=A0A6G0WIP5_9STRA|nr:hypothetical protein Ae201684_014834 [Aphanomyces euteiches]KAH9072715.1 hypothetical protein Ae201684P_015787 [Aphanomyces euteiches]
MPVANTCVFPTCHNAVTPGSSKCSLHKRRSRCSVPSCPNQVYARQVCVRHGAKPACNTPNCNRNARSGGFCSRHAPSTARKCNEEGCSNVAHQRGKCVRNGGRRQCIVDGCQTHARKGGYCCRHGHNKIETTHMALVTPQLEPVDLWGDLGHIFQDDSSLESSLISAIKFDSVEVAPVDWEYIHSILTH